MYSAGDILLFLAGAFVVAIAVPWLWRVIRNECTLPLFR